MGASSLKGRSICYILYSDRHLFYQVDIILIHELFLALISRAGVPLCGGLIAVEWALSCCVGRAP